MASVFERRRHDRYDSRARETDEQAHHLLLQAAGIVEEGEVEETDRGVTKVKGVRVSGELRD